MRGKSTKQRPLLERFWEKVQKTDGCWLWVGGRTPAGYGVFHFRHGHSIYAHRFSYELAYGPLPARCVCHHCDTPACVRPDHLFAGSDGDNHRDAYAKGRKPMGDDHWTRRFPERRYRGERHSNARLTEADIRAIRARVAAGEKQGAIAADYGVNRSHVSMIASRRHWAHVI